jgi:hypothetical protein
MRRARWIIVAAAAAFLAMLLVEFPARWAAPALPHSVTCGELDGTLWSGTCTDLARGGARLGDLAWTVHPACLIKARLCVDLALEQPQAFALRGRVELRLGGAIDARSARGTLPLEHRLLDQLPAGTSGRVDFDVSSLSWDGRRLTVLVGQIDVHALRSGSTALGDYRLAFAPSSADEPLGRITDLGGPFEVEGSLRLTRAPGYLLETRVIPRAGAPQDAVQVLNALGSPDAQGRRPFSIEGTF